MYVIGTFKAFLWLETMGISCKYVEIPWLLHFKYERGKMAFRIFGCSI